jgi:hypothetical protein
MDDDEEPKGYGGRLEAAFFWFLFGGFYFSLVAIPAGYAAGLAQSEVHRLVYVGAVVLGLFGAVSKLRPRGFP